jgi:hypothetical protein
MRAMTPTTIPAIAPAGGDEEEEEEEDVEAGEVAVPPTMLACAQRSIRGDGDRYAERNSRKRIDV